MNKKTKIILSISIILNIILAGFHLGHFFGMHPKNFMQLKEDKIIALLPEDKKDLARDTFKQTKEIRNQQFAIIRQHFADLEEVTVAENFDQEKFLAQFNEINDLFASMKNQSNIKIAQFLSQLDREERKKIVEQIKHERRPMMAP
ncbi:MAG: periplasmic heavy metal sensor [Pseudomonadota bacterium]